MLQVQLPPLRERREDIPLLVDWFWNEYCDGQHTGTRPCSPELIRRLMARDWPGNIRELRNFVRRTCVLGEDGPTPVGTPPLAAGAEGVCLPWKEHMESQEHQYLLQVLQQTGGQVRAAHQLMGISRKSLYEKINKYGIDVRPLRDKG